MCSLQTCKSPSKLKDFLAKPAVELKKLPWVEQGSTLGANQPWVHSFRSAKDCSGCVPHPLPRHSDQYRAHGRRAHGHLWKNLMCFLQACSHLFLPLFPSHVHPMFTYKICYLERLGPILRAMEAMGYPYQGRLEHLHFSDNSISIFTTVLLAGVLLHLNLLCPDLLHWSADC